MLTYRGLLDDATKQLYEATETPRIDAEVLMQHVIERPMAWLIAYGDTLATSDHIQAFYELISQRQCGQPIAYLTGQRDFWTLSLKVNNMVLIPRPDTETLVEQALARLPLETDLNVLDLGTGSGAIALSIAKERPQARVLAVDFQAGALQVAKENAALNKIANTDFLQSDWFAKVPAKPRFDLIASNPPYVESGDPHLEQGDLRFEPNTALIAHEEGLADIRNIIQTAPDYLNNHGWLLIEHGYTQASDVAALLAAADYKNVELFRDINDLPRCTVAQR